MSDSADVQQSHAVDVAGPVWPQAQIGAAAGLWACLGINIGSDRACMGLPLAR